MNKLFVAIICLTVGMPGTLQAAGQTWTPDPKIISKLEAVVKIPGGYGPDVICPLGHPTTFQFADFREIWLALL